MSAPPIQNLGDFELLEKIGHGGMGIVYKARQVSMDRMVAVKVLPSFATMDVDSVMRFQREAEAAGRLAHPGVVPVYAVGEEHGVHYFAMELVDGPSLHDVLQRLEGRRPHRLAAPMIVEADLAEKLPGLVHAPGSPAAANDYLRSCTGIALEIASALGAAHSKRIVHRDIKPSNVLLHPAGRAMLMDFGLAKNELALKLTHTGETLGTPSYMAPEQAAGKTDVDARADIYGLGAVLYEMLTLRPPFDGPNPATVMVQVQEKDPVPVRKHNPRVPPDLATIVQTCLNKNPDQRYPAIETLETDLRSFLAGKRILYRPPGMFERVRRWLRRHRKSAAAAFGAIVCTGAIAAVMGLLSVQEDRNQGLQALEDALREVVLGNVHLAREHYGRAQALLRDPAELQSARTTHAREAFQRLYPHRLAALREFLDTLSAAERAGLAEIYEKVAGWGTLSLRGVEMLRGETSLEVRSFSDKGLDLEWSAVGDRLAIGDYLVRVRASDGASLVRAVRIERDVDTAIHVTSLTTEGPPDGMVRVVDPRDETNFAVAEWELTRREYLDFLDNLADPILQGELLPRDWPSQVGADLPVRGLSFQQARTAAAHLGAHLPSRQEFRMAANAGLDRLRYPWGMGFEPDRLVADPDHRRAPEPVHSLPDGASPLGIQHLLGNVTELLSPSADGRYWTAGGHFQSLDPAGIRLDQEQTLFTELPAPDAPSRYAGMRLARFLPPADEMGPASAADERRKGILNSNQGSIVHDWQVNGNGSVDYAVTLTGTHERVSSERRLQLVTTGFLQEGELALTDGHGQSLDAEVQRTADREVTRITAAVTAQARPGQRYRMQIKTELLPAAGLHAEADSFVMRVPLKATGSLPVLYHVSLPPGSRIQVVDPVPDFRYHVNGVPHLVWHPALAGRQRIIPVVIRFRKDGMLTAHWPSRASVKDFVETLFATMATRDSDFLRRVAHPAFLELPTGRGFADLTRGSGTHSFSRPRIRDVTAVGPVVTVDLVCDWTLAGSRGQQVVVERWPLLLQLVAEGDSWRLLRILPRRHADTGEDTEDGDYFHRRLNTRLQPPQGAAITRTQDELTEMQVSVLPSRADGRVVFQVLGHFAADEESEESIRARLSAGAATLRKGTLLSVDHATPVGPLESQLKGRAEQWLFTAAGWSAREEWTFVTSGRRYFLIKSVAIGEDPDRAQTIFEQNRNWFEEMLMSVEIR